jgi:hypothetical protein
MKSHYALLKKEQGMTVTQLRDVGAHRIVDQRRGYVRTSIAAYTGWPTRLVRLHRDGQPMSVIEVGVAPR